MVKKRKRPSRKKTGTLSIILKSALGILALILISFATYLWITTGKSASGERVEEMILLSFSKIGIPATSIDKKSGHEHEISYKASLNGKKQSAKLETILRKSFSGFKIYITRESYKTQDVLLIKSGKDTFKLILDIPTPRKIAETNPSTPPKLTETKLPETSVHKGQPELAIILDDVGIGQMKAFKQAIEIPYPITFAVLPFRQYSQECSSLAKSRGYEVMLHMPMEPYGYPNNDPGPGAIFEKDSRKMIEKKLGAAFDNVRYAKGLNNHMGSRITALKFPVRVIINYLREHDKFIVDSRTTPESRVIYEAGSAGVKSIERKVFLDNSRLPQDIEKQLQEAIKEARKTGYAVAIGHNYPETVSVLNQMMPSMDNEINFVFAKDIVNGH